MEALLVFIPNAIHDQSPGYLIGCLREDNNRHRSIYIVGTCNSEEKVNSYPKNLVGCYSNKFCEFHPRVQNNYPVWISINCFNNKISLHSCKINNKTHNLKDCLLIVYDINNLLKSELLALPSKKNTNEINHFKILANDLLVYNSKPSGIGFNVLSTIIGSFVKIFSVINFILLKSSLVSQYSTLASHLKNHCRTVLWIDDVYKNKKHINLKLGNCLSSIFADMLLGLLMYYFVTRWKSADQFFDSISSCTENVISSISIIVKWLMGSPAGLKLNQPLSSLFGSMVLYYLEIWWSFLNLVRPILEISFQIFMKTGFLGLTFQLAVIADVFAIISFHVYCIYVYAARLYEIQAKGLYSLSRLFLGRKRNPEPGKIDSCPYSTEELLIGTISFAVLLFLLPTTLVYYVVFTVMRLGVIIIRGLMTRTIYFMQTLPIYVTFLWLFFPAYTANTVKVTPCDKVSEVNQGCLFAKPASSSWINTVDLCKPVVLPAPKPIKFSETLWEVMVGKLI